MMEIEVEDRYRDLRERYYRFEAEGFGLRLSGFGGRGTSAQQLLRFSLPRRPAETQNPPTSPRRRGSVCRSARNAYLACRLRTVE
jgi:hypothetical protein